NLRSVRIANPVELLHGGKTGEKEPKTKWIMAILGVVLLGVGYYISFTTKSPLKALTLFFLAVICVIVGTYLLFIAGSIALLKTMKKNKRYYYQTSHFTSVSGLIYRMKQNAVGLANICILSTMVLVMVSTTSAFMVGAEDIIRTRYPHEFEIGSSDTAIVEEMEQFMETEDVQVQNQVHYTYLSFSALRERERFYIPDDTENLQINDYDMDALFEIILLTQEEYSRLTGTTASLSDNEVLLYATNKQVKYDTLNMLDMELHVRGLLDEFPAAPTGVVGTVGLIVKDEAVLNVLNERQAAKYGKFASVITTQYEFDLAEGDQETVYWDLREWMHEHVEYDYRIAGSYNARESFMSLYGGLFFLGIFLGLLFLVETILIIYYKQISEGFDDQKRFAIMQNVGMSRAEVKRTIHSQIVIVFFLPLLIALLHVLAAFPLISRLLVLMNMTNTSLYLLCMLACFLVFAVVYAIVYLMTAKVYYRIVSK
ncbi:MAG: ABC transporter permease, partial [Oscillospiraceae bacterium]|nr:ABC transporter permease [Oscillospiraceae bacterium]